MNLLHLQPHYAALDLLRQVGRPFIVGAKLVPQPDGKTLNTLLYVNNVHKGMWLEETQMIEIVQRVAHMTQLPLVYAGHSIIGRTPAMFKAYTDVEVFATWESDGMKDELLGVREAAQGVSWATSDRLYVWGWLPGHVLETVQDMVKVKAARPCYMQGAMHGANGDLIVVVHYNAPWLRLVKAPDQILQEAAAHA